jgi:hypothetical protein
MAVETAAPPVVSVDLLRAASRSDTFPKEWTEERRRRSLARYEKFLLLAARHPDVPVAPCRDIDEFWHLHMLQPQAYHDDCMRLFGFILDHDGGFGKSEEEVPVLAAVHERTARLWREAYNEEYSETPEEAATDCWHDCQSRCWHDCSSKRN